MSYSVIPAGLDFVCEFELPSGEICRRPARWRLLGIERSEHGNYLCDRHKEGGSSKFGLVSNLPEFDAKTLAHHFAEYLSWPILKLSRLKGDWKKTLTAQVIKFVRRKGVLEEFEEFNCPNWSTAYYAVLNSPLVVDDQKDQKEEPTNGTAVLLERN